MIDVILKYFNPNPKNKHFIEEMVVFLKKQEISRATILWTGPGCKMILKSFGMYLDHLKQL